MNVDSAFMSVDQIALGYCVGVTFYAVDLSAVVFLPLYYINCGETDFWSLFRPSPVQPTITSIQWPPKRFYVTHLQTPNCGVKIQCLG